MKISIFQATVRQILSSCRMHLLCGFVVASLMAACAGSTTPSTPTTTADTQLGSEEFGLTKRQLVEKIEEVEAKIATCMSEAGFDYVAVDYETVRRAMTSDKSLPGVSDEAFLTQYGYGLATLYTGLAPQFDSTDTPAKIGLGEQNIQILSKLSTVDQVAYNRTLLGQNTDATFAVAIEMEDFSRTGGCTRTAIEQAFNIDELKASYYNPLDARVNQDQRMIAALTEFSDCLRQEGFNYNHPDDIESDIKERLDAITKGLPLDQLPPGAKAALTELQGEERKLAVVATDCVESIVEPVEAQILQELSK